MVFNDTVNKNGLIQTVEFWTRMPDGTITGTLLSTITARINAGFDNIMPLLLSYTDNIRWDDTNHTDRPIGTFDITSGQNDYAIAEDDNNLDILNVSRFRIFESSTATEYRELERMYIDDKRALDALSPNPTVTGIPTHFIERGNSLFLYPNPNYASTNGGQIFFEREQSFFASTDTTKEVGIPKPFHELLALYASLDWIVVNRAEDTTTITRIENRIMKKEQDLMDMISKRNPTPAHIRPNIQSNK